MFTTLKKKLLLQLRGVWKTSIYLLNLKFLFG
jgi:hypothetical protein